MGLADKFKKYHKDNPKIYKEFKKISKALYNRGYKRYSARDIFPIIRWQTKLSGNDGWKVNNSYSPYYADMFMKEHPEYGQFFYTRKRE